MRTAPSRVRRLLGLLVVAVSVGWLLLRRRTGSVLPLPATTPSPAPRPPARPAAPEVLATDAGLTAEPAAPAPHPVAAPAPDILATDAGLTPAGPAEDAASPEAVDTAAPAPADSADSLQAIRGVGPAIERTLHELGITTFRQVAGLQGAELEAVRQRLDTFSGRIERQDWAGQARELHRQKYGEAP
jgi:predicted flap endonuclease-1-like 5' DNA nuclease